MSRINTGVKCRRRHKRFVVPKDAGARVNFDFPRAGDHPCSMALRDISAGGLCFVLEHDLPGLDVGQVIDQSEVLGFGQSIRGELFLMHLTPAATKGAVCGALFFPAGDRNILAWQALVAGLEQRSKGVGATSARVRD
jgi:hypothetical protein